MPERLKEILRDSEDGQSAARSDHTVASAVKDWLEHGLTDRDPYTIKTCTMLATRHIIPELGARKLRDLSAEDIDRWLVAKSRTLSTSTLQRLHSILSRALKRAMARDHIRRNVAQLSTTPAGQPGRRSKALTFAQAEAILRASEQSRMHAYIVLSLLTGARTEELRALTWDHVDLDGDPDASPPIPPHLAVWRSVRAGGDTKTRKSRRTIALPTRCVKALRNLRDRQGREHERAGDRWQDDLGLVFTTRYGTPLNAAGVRRDFRTAIKNAEDIDPSQWTPRELRHSFVSLLSDNRVPLERISLLVGHKSTVVTELVYRQQIRPVLQDGAQVMDSLFGEGDE